MSVTSNKKKKCPQCGKKNIPEDKFCTQCGFELKEYSPEDFVIIEHLKGSLYGSIACLTVFIAFMILITVAIPTEYGLQGIIPMFIIWPIVIIFMVWASRYLRGLSKIRKFIITGEYIEITVPHKPYFRVNWSEFDAIEVQKRDHQTWAVLPGKVIIGPRFIYFKLIFKGINFSQSYEFESGKDFKRKSRKDILIALEEFAQKKNKDYNGPTKK